MDQQEREAARYRFLRRLYEETGGNQSATASMWKVGADIGLGRQDIDLIVQYLKGEHLVEPAYLGGGISITHYGVKQIEEAQRNPQEKTRYFPAVVNINNNNFAGPVTGSTIQQAGANSHLSSNLNVREIQAFLDSFKQALPNLGSEDTRNEAMADIAIVEAELKRPSQRASLIWEYLKSLRTILEGAAGGALGNQVPVLIEQVTKLLGGS